MEFLKKNYLESQKNNKYTPILTPPHKEIFLGKEETFFNGNFEVYKIEFNDGSKGNIFYKKKYKKYRIDCFGTYLYYLSKTSAIDGLYYFMINKKILENDRTYI